MALNKIQGLHNNIIIKAVLVLIALTFIWSLGDFNNFTNENYVAKVGNKTITIEDYRRAHTNFMNQYQASLQGLTSEQLDKLGISKIIINSLVQEKLKQLLAEEVGISISDHNLIKMIKTNPNFQTNEAFDIDKFKRFLKNHHLTEREFTEIYKENTSTSILFNNLHTSYIPNKLLSEVLYNYYFEKRFFDLYIIAPNPAFLSQPSEAELEKFYNQHKANYQKPESRVINLLTFDQEKFKPQIAVTEQEIEQYYKDNSLTFSQPETRDFDLFIFNNQADADKVKKDQHPDSTALSKSYKAIAKANLPENSADIIFNTNLNSFSEIFKQEEKFVVAKVTKINPSLNPAFSDVKDDIKKRLIEEKQASLAASEANKIEEEIQMSMDINEIAKTHNLEDSLVKLNVSGGFKTLPQAVLNEILGSSSKDTEIATDDKKLYVYKIEKINPAAEIPLASVKNEVVQDYQEFKTQNEIQNFATLLKTTLSSGELKLDFDNHRDFTVTKKPNISLVRLNLTAKNLINEVPAEFVNKLETTTENVILERIQDKIYIAKITKSEIPAEIDPNKLEFIQNNQINDSEKVFEQEILTYLFSKYKVKIAENLNE